MPSDGAEAPGPARPRPGAWVAAVVVGVVVLDQCTKAWAVDRLARGPVWVLGDDVGLRLTRNPGGAFSLLQGFTPVLALVAVVLTALLVRAVVRTRHPLTLLALALVLGGALGNLVDRLTRRPGFLRGAVVDFVVVGSFPTFNVADAAITVGAVLLVLAVLRGDADRAPTEGTAASPAGSAGEVRDGG